MLESEQFSLYGTIKSRQEITEYLDNYYQTVIDAGYKHRTAHLLDMLPQHDSVRILDYGCGLGVFTRLISEHNSQAEVLGIDIDFESVRIANAWLGKRSHIEINNRSIEDLETSSFDFVISMQVIEHVHNVGNYLQSISRVLKPEGILLITLPNIMNPLHLLRLLFSMNRLSKRVQSHSEFISEQYIKPQHHINGWDPYHFTTLVSSMGYLVKEVRMVDGVPIPYLGRILRRKSLIYWRTQIPGVRNLSTRMVFKLQKIRDTNILQTD